MGVLCATFADVSWIDLFPCYVRARREIDDLVNFWSGSRGVTCLVNRKSIPRLDNFVSAGHGGWEGLGSVYILLSSFCCPINEIFIFTMT